MDEPTQVAVLSSIPVEYRLVPGTRGTLVIFHGGHMRAGGSPCARGPPVPAGAGPG